MASPTVSFRMICNFWKDFDLDNLRGKLDEQGLTIAENQESSVTNRRKLAETTKEFRRHASSETSKQVAVLLKSYQEEVDRLTNRAKFSEAAFLDVYQKLYEAPDPAQPLLNAMELEGRAAQAESVVQKMAVELAEYQAESKELHNQERTVRKLEERVRDLEAQLIVKDKQMAEVREEAAAESDAAALEEMRAKEEALAAELEGARASLENMRRLHQASQNQLFAVQSRSEEERVGMQSELEIATEEVERAQHRLASLEHEKAGLVAQVQAAQRGDGEDGGNSPKGGSSESSLRTELYAQQELGSRLRSELLAMQQSLEDEVSAWEGKCQRLEAEVAAQQERNLALEAQLAASPTPEKLEELRQQVTVLQAVAYGIPEGENGDGGRGGRPADAGNSPSLENLLLEKNRRLEHDLMLLRRTAAESAGRADEAEERANTAEAERSRQAELIARLEQDLVAAEGAGDRQNGSGEYGAEILDENGEEGNSMVRVLCNQRDRFRKRALELEEERAWAVSEAERLKQDLEASRSDNVALLERVKFVQNYQPQQGSKQRQAVGDVESRYQTVYEERMNPFSSWKTREKENQKQKMSIADRAVFEFTQIISGNRYARLFVFFYTVLLHMLIFWVLAMWSHKQADKMQGLDALCARYSQEGRSGVAADTLKAVTGSSG